MKCPKCSNEMTISYSYLLLGKPQYFYKCDECISQNPIMFTKSEQDKMDKNEKNVLCEVPILKIICTEFNNERASFTVKRSK